MTETESLNRNHIKLSYWHIGFAIFYTFLFGTVILLLGPRLPVSGKISAAMAVGWIPLIHLALAWGSRVKSNISRRISMFIGFLLFLGFPIGTFISLFFFLPLTDWEQAPALDWRKAPGRS